MKHLKPCPFCGGKADEFILLKNGKKIRFVIQCENQCGSTYPMDTEEEAVQAWNRRADTEAET